MQNDDDHRTLFSRNGLVHILDADAGICEALSVPFGVAGYRTSFSLDAQSFFASLDRLRPEVVLVSLQAGHDDGLSVLRRLRAMRRDLIVFALADQPQVENAVAAIKAGATDVLTRPIDAGKLVRAVRHALRVNGHGAARRQGRGIEVHGFAQLTPRERQVLQLIASGHTNKEAGRALGISPRTVEVHRARVMDKLGARNAADLTRIVLTE